MTKTGRTNLLREFAGDPVGFGATLLLYAAPARPRREKKTMYRTIGRLLRSTAIFDVLGLEEIAACYKEQELQVAQYNVAAEEGR